MHFLEITSMKFERNVTIRAFDVLFVLKVIQNVHLKLTWPLWSPKKGLWKVSFLPSLIRLQSKAKSPTVLIFQKNEWFHRFVWRKGQASVSVPTLPTLMYWNHNLHSYDNNTTIVSNFVQHISLFFCRGAWYWIVTFFSTYYLLVIILQKGWPKPK